MFRKTIGAVLACAFVSFVLPSIARADDAAALRLADLATVDLVQQSNWRTSIELATGNYNEASQSSTAQLNDTLRASLATSYDGWLTSTLRAVFANRLDSGWRVGSGDINAVDTLQQAYLSWQGSSSLIVDSGRVNLRQGVGVGFNPTDFFKADALHTVVSVDPASLRENRLGTVMMRGQWVWNGGSVSALVAPRLANGPDNAVLNPDLGATNHQWRYQLTANQRLFDGFSPEWLIYGEEGLSPQFGVNLTTLAGDATVAFLEYSGGRSATLYKGNGTSSAFHSKLAAGLTHTFPAKVSVTLEYDYDGASADQSTWSSLAGNPAQYWAYRSTAYSQQDLTTRHSLFLYATWTDAFILHLDVTTMMRYDLVDHSFITWMETRYHWTRADLAVQWQLTHGLPYSNYGATAQANIVQGVLTFFF